MASFNKIFEDILLIEGGYSDHPHDSGGKTAYGITEATARRHGYNGNMRDLPLNEAKYIYEHFFFNNYGFDKIQNTKIASELFDFTINTGRNRTAVEFLQRSFNLLNKNIHLVEDGILGDNTAHTINNYKYYKSLYRVQNILQGAYYIAITEDDKDMKADLVDHTYTAGSIKNKTFFRGWIDNRVSV